MCTDMTADRKPLTYDLDEEAETQFINLVQHFSCISEKQVNVKVHERYVKMNVKLQMCSTKAATFWTLAIHPTNGRHRGIGMAV